MYVLCILNIKEYNLYEQYLHVFKQRNSFLFDNDGYITHKLTNSKYLRHMANIGRAKGDQHNSWMNEWILFSQHRA